MERCPQRKELQDAAETALQCIKDLTSASIEALRAGDNVRLLALDKELELAIGDKERRFGALQQHTSEHGC
jgi:hypothetical protein